MIRLDISGAKGDARDVEVSSRRGPGWVRCVIALAARVALLSTLGLVFWSVVPAALGWEPTVVQTGSMEPEIVPGDIVVARPVPTEMLAMRQILLVDDPDHAGDLRLHRLTGFHTDGTLELRGDANEAPDSSAVSREAVHGVAVLRIPYVGLPVVWLGQDRYGELAALGGALLLLLWLSRAEPALGVTSARLAAIAVVIGGTVAGVTDVPAPAHAAMSAQTTTDASWLAATLPAPTGAIAFCTLVILRPIIVSWNAPGGASGYTVERATSTGAFAVVGTTGGALTFTDTSAPSATLVRYRISRSEGVWKSLPSASSTLISCL